MASLKVPCKVFDSDSKRDAFVEGWKAAGGYVGDIHSDTPWCAPWFWAAAITVDLDTWIDDGTDDAYEALGAAFWQKVGPEVEELLEEERRAAEDRAA